MAEEKTGLKIGGSQVNAIDAANPAPQPPAGVVQEDNIASGLNESERAWTSHPIANYAVGDFRFENGILRLDDPEKIAEFEKLLEDKNFPASERHRIRELDVKGAEAISRKIRSEQGGNATKQSDSTIGERAVAPKTGTGDLASSKDGGAVKS